jgi:cobalt/nickel transport system permease protein
VHLADGILTDPTVLIGFNLAGATGVALALRRSLGDEARTVAWTGTLGAFALAIQALNVPLVPGASAHAIGAGLLTVALGPARAIVALGAVLLVQALLFADGGVTVLGINAWNLAVVPALAVHGARRLLESRFGLGVATTVGTLLGAVGGALGLSTVLVTGAAAPFALTFGWLLGVQALAGLCEGVLTSMAVRHLAARAPALIARPSAAPVGRGLAWTAVAIGVTLALLPLASSQPDALEAVIARLRAMP